MEYLLIYLLQIIDTIPIFLIGIIISGTLVSIIIRCMEIEDGNGDCTTSDLLKITKKPVAICLISILLFLLIPTKQTILLMGGVYYGNKIITSEIGQKAYKIIDLQLDKYIKELTDGSQKTNSTDR